MQCTSCGNQLAPGAAFCGQCGNSTSSAAQANSSANNLQVGQSQASPNASGPASQQPGFQQYTSQTQWIPTPATSGKAVASLVLSLFGLSLFAVIFGHIARAEIRNSRGRLTGDGLALAGLIIGWVGMAAYLAVLFFIALGAALYSGF